MRSVVAAALLAATAFVGATAGCSSSANGTSAASEVDVANAALIDVRTPAEFASGHVEGASNIDVQAADFSARISQPPKDAPYVVYCRSGNRSTEAISQMKELGFTNLLNGGSVQEAADVTGKPVVN